MTAPEQPEVWTLQHLIEAKHVTIKTGVTVWNQTPFEIVCLNPGGRSDQLRFTVKDPETGKHVRRQ